MGPEANLCLARAPVHRLGFRASLPHCQKLGLPLGLRANEGLPGDLRRREGEDFKERLKREQREGRGSPVQVQ